MTMIRPRSDVVNGICRGLPSEICVRPWKIENIHRVQFSSVTIKTFDVIVQWEYVADVVENMRLKFSFQS